MKATFAILASLSTSLAIGAEAPKTAANKAPSPAAKSGAMEDVQKTPSEVIDGFFAGLGDVRIRIDTKGEPISKPLRIQVELSYGQSIDYKILLQNEGACAYYGLTHDAASKSLMLEVGRYDPDKSACSQRRTIKIAIP